MGGGGGGGVVWGDWGFPSTKFIKLFMNHPTSATTNVHTINTLINNHAHTYTHTHTHTHAQTHTLPTNHTAFNLGGGGGAFMGSSLAAPTNVGGALGAPQAPNEAWVQQINEHIKALNRSPYGDSPLFKNLVLVAGCMGWLCVVG